MSREGNRHSAVLEIGRGAAAPRSAGARPATGGQGGSDDDAPLRQRSDRGRSGSACRADSGPGGTERLRDGDGSGGGQGEPRGRHATSPAGKDREALPP